MFRVRNKQKHKRRKKTIKLQEVNQMLVEIGALTIEPIQTAQDIIDQSK
jgi:hypothetical protein